MLFLSTVIKIDGQIKLGLNEKAVGILSRADIILGFITFMGLVIMILYYKLFTREDEYIEEGKKLKTHFKKRNRLDRWSILFSVIFTIALIFAAAFLASCFNPNLENKKNYELAHLTKTDSKGKVKTMLMVGRYKDSAILMDIVDSSGGELVFQKCSYRFEPLENLQLQYRRFKGIKANM